MFKSGLVLAIGQLLSVFLLFFQNTLLAKYFGASSTVDAYVIASTLPSLISSLVSVALTGGGVFLPMFASHREVGGSKEGWEFANVAILTLTGILLIIILGVIIFRYQIVGIIAPESPIETKNIAANLLLWSSPMILVNEWMYFGLMLLNYFKKNFVFAFCLTISSSFGVLFLLTLNQTLGIFSLIISPLVGGVLVIGISLNYLRKIGYRLYYVKKDSFHWVKQVLRVSWPAMVSMGISNISMTVDKIMASSVGVGTITQLYYAQRILQLPIQIIPNPIINLFYPYIVDYVSRSETGKAKEAMYKGYRLMFLLLMPCAVGLFILAIPTVELIFEKGEFNHLDTILTGYILKAFMGEIVFYSLGSMVSRYLMSRQKISFLTMISSIRLAINILLNVILTKALGAIGIPLATSITSGLSSIALVLIVEKRNIRQMFVEIGYFSAKIVFASLMMGFFIHYSFLIVYREMSLNFSILLTMSSSIPVYFFIVYLLRVEEMYELRALALSKIKKIF